MREVRRANAKGYPDEPLSDDELFAKFKANVSCAGISESKRRCSRKKSWR
jgi:hypothetical protein